MLTLMTRNVVLTIGLLIAAVSAQANLLVNGSFESVDASAPPFYIRSNASTPGWTQYLDGVDLIHNDYSQTPAVLVDASDGDQFLDMNQAGAIGGIYQIVASTAGLSYTLNLDAAAWAGNAIGSTVGYDLYDAVSNATLATGSYTDPTGGTWSARQLNAVATSGLLGVRIYGISATQAGMGVDNVVLDATVPEPGTFLLIGSILFLFGLRHRLAQALSHVRVAAVSPHPGRRRHPAGAGR